MTPNHVVCCMRCGRVISIFDNGFQTGGPLPAIVWTAACALCDSAKVPFKDKELPCPAPSTTP